MDSEHDDVDLRDKLILSLSNTNRSYLTTASIDRMIHRPLDNFLISSTTSQSRKRIFTKFYDYKL